MPFLLFSVIYNLKLYCNNHWLKYGFHHRKSSLDTGIHSFAVPGPLPLAGISVVLFFQQKLKRGGQEDGNWHGLGGRLVLVEVILHSSLLFGCSRWLYNKTYQQPSEANRKSTDIRITSAAEELLRHHGAKRLHIEGLGASHKKPAGSRVPGKLWVVAVGEEGKKIDNPGSKRIELGGTWWCKRRPLWADEPRAGGEEAEIGLDAVERGLCLAAQISHIVWESW